MSALTEALDRYLDRLHRTRPQLTEIPDSLLSLDWAIPDFSLDALEEVVGFDLPVDVRELWDHPVRQPENWLPYASDIDIVDPEILIGFWPDRSHRLCPIEVDTQIAILSFGDGDDEVMLIADALEPANLWVAGQFFSQPRTHPYQLTLDVMVDLWTDAIDAGEVIWDGGPRLRSSTTPDARPNFFDGSEETRRWYARRPGGVDGLTQLAADRGAVVDEVREYDEFEVQVASVVDARIERWEQLVGPLPERCHQLRSISL